MTNIAMRHIQLSWQNPRTFDWAMFNSYVCLPEGQVDMFLKKSALIDASFEESYSIKLGSR